jgi:transcriptional regulator with XRE-family HTH domain
MVEAARAKFWRKSVLHISRAELAARTGYSVMAISRFEAGYDHHGRALNPKTTQRYRLVCAGLTLPNFNWREPE